MPHKSLQFRPPRWRLVTAFAAVYLIWGSTYLAIRIAIETIPPFLMAGIRFLIAGAILYVWARWRGTPPPRRAHWLAAAIVGGLLLVGGNGGVVWAEQRVPSGLTALLIATVPLWMALLNWLRPGGVKPDNGVIAGLALGFIGIMLLVGPGELAGGHHVDSLGAAVLIVASLSWAAGSLYSRRAQLPASPLLTTGMEMLTGGALLLIAGSLAGEWTRFELSALSVRSSLALTYLIVFGALIGFTAYIWLLRVSTPARASTYAYVNPVVAIFLGWALASEPLTARTLLAAAIIVAAVVVITTQRAQSVKEKEHAQDERRRLTTSRAVSEIVE
ncbi:MAG: putative inner membrane transporter YedA [bacterium]|nr:putative inner membrane transporter YedA [bacterium]